MLTQTSAAPRRHQNDGPPRLNSSRCGDNHIAAGALKQRESAMNRPPMLAVQAEQYAVANKPHFNPQQVEILKNSICRGSSDDEFQVFLMACERTKLDPFMKQIYAIQRRSKKHDGSWGQSMTIQTSIDGYRLIAERTERYAPGPEPTYVHEKGALISATAYIKKMTADGTWHVVSASAYMDEYCQKTREGQPMGMWATMPRTMLAKCAESQALRKAFPAEMSGIYTKEEMQQADVEVVQRAPTRVVELISTEQAAELEMILHECDEKYKTWVHDHLKKQYNANNLAEVPLEIYERMRIAAVKNMEQNHAKQRQEEPREMFEEKIQ